jgi:hypothetical protein
MLLGVTEAKQYQANDGYADKKHTVYYFDRDVGNCRQISVGDFILQRWNRQIVGAALVGRLDRSKKQKRRNLCSRFSSTAAKRRLTATPKRRCPGCSAAFDDPLDPRGHGRRLCRPL